VGPRAGLDAVVKGICLLNDYIHNIYLKFYFERNVTKSKPYKTFTK